MHISMHLSDPDGLNVNAVINTDDFSLHYVTIDDANHIIHRHNPGCLSVKADLKHAFRICPVNKSDLGHPLARSSLRGQSPTLWP